ncbi:MAG: insulinase family protein, partial [Bdellovibrionales bacterium]|nr:insulinase family protein [Bdellovibrionales bacterium]
MQRIETLANGLTVIIEEISHVESVAYDLFIPGGIIYDKADKIGASLILSELSSRGAGGLSSRELSDAFESLGISRSEGTGQDRYIYAGNLIAKNLDRAIELTAKMLSAPLLPKEEVPNIKNILLQDIHSLNDSPVRRAMIELSKNYLPDPFGRPNIGTLEGIKSTSIVDLKAEWLESFKPNGSVLSIAGKVKVDDVLKIVEKHLGSWKGDAKIKPNFGKVNSKGSKHIDYDGAQLQVTVAYPAAKFGDKHYYTAKVLNGVLSGGFTGRLFVEVREKRGLCYHISASHGANASYGAVTCYAGTTPERAQETLDVMLSVLKGVKGNVSEEELKRSKALILSSLVIGEESTSSRAASNAGDWWT